MKKQTAKTIITLSLFVTLLVSASHVSAFPVCTRLCKPAVQSAAAAPAPTVNSVPVQVVSSVVRQPDDSLQFIALLWLPMARFFASLL